MSKRRVFYDWEFLENGTTIMPISVGMVDREGKEYYAVNSDMDEEVVKKHEWISRNVWPHLPVNGYTEAPTSVGGGKTEMRPSYLGTLDRTSTFVRPLWVIRNEILAFLSPEDSDLELWGYYGAYDHVTLAQLWGPMIKLPKGIPMFTHELMQLWELAGQPEKPLASITDHKAIDDARRNHYLFERCFQALAQKDIVFP